MPEGLHELRAQLRRWPAEAPLLRVLHRTRVEDEQYWSPYGLRLMFVLAGAATQREGARQHRVEAPGLLVQRPRGAYVYGGERRDELILVYPPHLWKPWREMGLIDPEQPARQIVDHDSFDRCAAELLHSLAQPTEPWRVDIIDRLGHLLLLSAIRPVASEPAPAAPDPLKQVHSYIEAHFAEPIDIADLALRHGMSPSTLRRHWKRQWGLTPLQFIHRRRMTEACRLLVETRKPIAEIARAVGYEDPFHFSRTFRRLVGVSPTKHRAEH